MVDAPVINKTYKGPDLNKYRDEKPEKFVGGPVFVVKGFKNEKARIQVEIKIKNLLMKLFKGSS